jgi:hypothetical protein
LELRSPITAKVLATTTAAASSVVTATGLYSPINIC